MNSLIPFNRPAAVGPELDYIAEAIRQGNIGGDGSFTAQCGELLQRITGSPRVLMTPSCTASLEMAAMLCDLSPGDEVIMPSFTFVSTANAVVRLGARPVFVDVRGDTLNLDERLVPAAITPRTKAIVVVHYAGVAAEMDELLSIARRLNLRLIEDAAQAVTSTYQGRALGSLGDLGTFSFHETKNYNCGEGGGLCINDPALIQRAEIIRDKGTNRSRFFRGQVDKYTWVDLGSSYVPSEIACAYLFAQLQHVAQITARRKTLYENYLAAFAPLAERGLVTLPVIPPECQSNYHLFHLVTRDGDTRTRLIAHLKSRGVQAVFHYVPLHSAPMAKQLGLAQRELPITDRAGDCLVRLPLYHALTDAEQQRVVDAVLEFFKGK